MIPSVTISRTRVIRAVAVAVVAAGCVVPAFASPAAAASTYYGPDVASYQHPNGKSINWKDVKRAGKDFAFVKATEGTTYTNPYFSDDYSGAADAGLVRGAYAFARPATPVISSAKAQAKMFAATLGSVTTTATLPPVLDLEVTGGLGRGQLVSWAQTFLLTMRSLTGRTPMLYTYPNFYDSDLGDSTALTRYPLWMASYGTSHAPDADLWQYTSGASIKGISGKVDESKYVGGGSGEPWSTLSDGTVATPWVSSPPAPPRSVSATAGSERATVSWLPGDAGTAVNSGSTVTVSPGGQTVDVGAGATSAVVGGLTNGTAYTFTVTSSNSVGTSGASGASNVVTPMAPTTLSLSLGSSVSDGAAVPVQATLQRSDTSSKLAGQQVVVSDRNHGSGGWTTVATLRTNGKGAVSETLRPYRSIDVRVSFAGTNSQRPSSSSGTTTVRPVVHAHLSRTTDHPHGRVTVTGSTNPPAAGERIKWEQLEHGSWTVRRTTKASAHGHFRFHMRPAAKGINTYRYVATAIAGRGAGHSKDLRLTVR